MIFNGLKILLNDFPMFLKQETSLGISVFEWLPKGYCFQKQTFLGFRQKYNFGFAEKVRKPLDINASL